MKHDKDPTLIVNIILLIIFVSIGIMFLALASSAIKNNPESAVAYMVFACITFFISGIGATSLYTEKEIDDMALHPKTNREWIETLDDDKFTYIMTSLSPCDLCTEKLAACKRDSFDCCSHIVDWLNADYNPDDVFIKNINDAEDILND